MKPKRNLLILAARALVYTCVTSSANAANGTWTSNADANWNAATTAPWAGGIVADGADATADFSTIDITAARTVTMTEDRTIGNLKFDDTGASGDSNWTLLRSGATPTLTLQTSSGSPTITVTNTATFGSSTNGFVLAGANGFTKSGAGTLVFADSNKNTYGGVTTIAQGTLQVGASGVSGRVGSATTEIAISAGATFNYYQGSAVTQLISGAGNFSSSTGLSAGAVTCTLSGTNTYTGVTTISSNNLTLGVIDNGGVASSMGASGNAASNLVMGGGSTLGYLGASASTTDRLFTLSGTATISNNSTSGNSLTFSNTGAVAFSASNSARSFTLGGSNADLNVFSPQLTDNGTGVVTLGKTGAGTWSLTNTHSFTGSTTISGGTLQLDYTTNNTNKISATNPVILSGGGNLEFVGNTGSATSQGVKGLTLSGSAAITLTTAAGKTLSADFTANSGTLTRAAGAGLDVFVSGSGTPQLKLPGTTASTAVIPWITYNGGFAATDASNNIIQSSISTVTNQSDEALWTSGANHYVNTEAWYNSVASDIAIDGFTFRVPVLSSVYVEPANVVTINQGIINLTSVGNNASSVDSGTIRGAAGGTLNILQQNVTKALTITSSIASNAGSGLTKEGSGALIISKDSNPYTGPTVVNGGELQALVSTAAGAKSPFGTGAITANTGSSLRLKTGSTSNALTYANAVNLNAATLISEDGVTTIGGPVSMTGASAINVVWSGKTLNLSGNVTGSGSLALSSSSSASTLLLSGTSTYSGTVAIANSTLSVPATGNVTGLGAVAMNNNGSAINVSGTLSCGALTGGAATTSVTVNAGGTFSPSSFVASFTSNATVDGTYNPGSLDWATNSTNTVGGAGTINTGNFTLRNFSVITFTNATLNASGNFYLGNSTSQNGTFNQSSGAVNLTSSTADTIRLGHWPSETGTYSLSGGTLSATATDTVIGWDGAGVLNISAGTASLKGIRMGNAAGGNHNGNGTVTLTGGRLNLGSGGWGSGGTGTKTVSLGAGTVGAFADWTGAVPMALTDAATGTTFHTLDSANGSSARTITLSAALSGTGALVKTGAGTLALSGANTFSGATTLSAGALALDFTSQNNSKLSDTSALNLGTATLSLSGGSHAETVLSTTLSGNATITRASGTGTINLNAITAPAGTSLNLSASNIATTDTLNNSAGILGSWATVNGTDWAANATNAADGAIVAFTGYTDVNRMGGSIASSTTSNVRIIDAGSSGNVTLGAAGTVDAASALNSVTSGATTIDLTGGTLRLATGAGIFNPANSGALTISNGTLTAGTGAIDTAGDLVLNNASITNDLTVGSVIANNGIGVVSVTKLGAGKVILTGANTATGTYTIGAGALQVGNAGGTGIIGAGSSITDNGSLILNRSDVGDLDLTGIISGTGSVVCQGTGVSNQSRYAFNNASTYTGGTTVNNSRAVASLAGSLGTGPVTVTSGGQTFISAAVTLPNAFTISGTGWAETAGSLGAIRLVSGSGISGNITLSADARIGAQSTGTLSGTLSAPGMTLQIGAPAASGGSTINGTVAFSRIAGSIISSNTTVDVQSGTLRYDNGGSTGSFATGSNVNVQAASGTTVSLLQTESSAYTSSKNFTMGNQITLNGATLALGGSFGAQFQRLLSSTAIQIGSTGGTIAQVAGGGSEYSQFVTVEGAVSGTGALALNRAGNTGNSPTRNLNLKGSFTGFSGNVTIGTSAAPAGAVVFGHSSGWGSGSLTLNGAGSNVVIGDYAATNVNGSWTGGSALAFTTGTLAPAGAITVGAGASLSVANLASYALLVEPQGSLTVNGGTLGSTGSGGASAFVPATSGTWVFGGSSVSTVSANVQLNHGGAVFQVADAVAGSSVDATISGVVSGSNGFTKTGAGTLSLTGANTYTGDTTVSAGTLSESTASLADASTVNLAASAVLDLNFAGTDTVDKLFIGGSPMTAGTYGASGSGATNIDNTHFSGTGTLTVTSTGVAGYSSWETANGITGAGAKADSDGDGIPNGIEFVIGGDPSGPGSDSNALLPTVTLDGTYLNFVFRRTDASSAYASSVQYGSSLTGWTTAVHGVNGVNVTTDDNFYDASTDRVTVRVPRALAAGNKLFARLKVDITP